MRELKSTVLFFIVILLNFNISFAQSNINQTDQEGKRHGVWRKYFSNARIRYQGEFTHGKEIGTFKFFSAVNSDHPIVIKKYKSGSAVADVTFYSVEGVLESAGEMNGKKRIGTWTFYHPDGKTIMSVENYAGGRLDGEYKTFYKTGKPTEVAYYKGGLLDSVYKKYSIKGYLYQHFTYRGGKLNGKAVYYSRKTGDLTTKGLFRNDIRVGIWENYVDGELISTEQPALKKKAKEKN